MKNRAFMDLKRDNQKNENEAKDFSIRTRLFQVWLIYLIGLLLIMPCEAGKKMKESKPNLPKTVGDWFRPDSPHLVNAKNIFDYMDGAGELYIGYRFDHLEVYEYEADTQKSILVELYYMNTSDDAFGLLSLDWGGEAVDSRALYGEGLLRLWSDNIYARIMAYQETPESKEAVLTLGQAITRDRPNPPRSELLKSLPDTFPPDWTLRTDRVSYFRSYLVLNSIYYLAQENILDLDHSSEAVIAPYERKNPSQGSGRIQFLKVRYSDDERAHTALSHFHKVFLPEHSLAAPLDPPNKIVNTYQIEDGWLGYALHENCITFALECPDQETARTIMEHIR